MERIGAECVALSKSLGDNSALNYAYWNIATDYTFRGLMREAREWALKLLDAGRERNDRRALGIAHLMLSMIDIFNGNRHEALTNAKECVRTAVTPYDRRMGAIVGPAHRFCSVTCTKVLSIYSKRQAVLQRWDGPDGRLRNHLRRHRLRVSR